MSKMEEIGISVSSLYEKYGSTLKYGTINMYEENDIVYYDLYNEKGEIACMDGEACFICEDIYDNFGSQQAELLMNGESGKPVYFRLSVEELSVATFRSSADKWLLKIAYSWGDEESDQEFASEKEAWDEAVRSAKDEVYTASVENNSPITVYFNPDQKTIRLDYLYDGESCRYDVVKW